MTKEVGPFVVVASFAEHLKDNDDSYDLRLIHGCLGLLPPFSLAGEMRLRFVLMLEAGEMEGTFPLLVRFHAPSGTELMPLLDVAVTIHGGRLAVLDHPISLLLEEAGQYRASVYFDGELLTRTSLIVRRTEP
jgi:hypothetical protein